MLRGLELQYTTRSRVMKTRAGEALAFSFRIGPLSFYVIANIPENDEDALVYVKVTLSALEGWLVFKEHPNGD